MNRNGELATMPERVTEKDREAVQKPAGALERSARADAVPQPTMVTAPPDGTETIFGVQDVHVYYGEHRAVRDVRLDLYRNHITALIGPSGCGKSTFIRCLNRMNDLIATARVEGSIVYHG